MQQKRFLLPIIIFQFIPIILFPLATITSGIAVIAVVIVIFGLLGYGLWRGRIWALYMSIFMQGMNIIIRIMMFFPHAVNIAGNWDLVYVILNVIAMVLSGWFLIRLDRPDVYSLIAA